MVPGGIILVHDYGCYSFRAARMAVDEFCESIGISPVEMPDRWGSAVLRKPISAKHAGQRHADELAKLRMEIEGVRDDAASDLSRALNEASEAWRKELEQAREEAAQERRRLQEAHRSELELTREQVIQQMRLPARARRLLGKVLRRTGLRAALARAYRYITRGPAKLSREARNFARRLRRLIRLLRRQDHTLRQALAPYFDAEYYRKSNPDLAEGCDHFSHFMEVGWKEGRNPSQTFDVKAYLEINPDVTKAGINPLYHHIVCGPDQPSEPIPLSEEEAIAQQHREVIEPYFDAEFYRNSNPDLSPDCDPYWHFMLVGWKEGRNPSATFDVKYYLETYSDVSKNPLYHYVLFGMDEGRVPSEAARTKQQQEAHKGGFHYKFAKGSYRIILCVLWFHARYKPAGYARSIARDIREFSEYLANPLFTRPDTRFITLTTPISDPTTILGDQLHDSLLFRIRNGDPSFLADRKLNMRSRLWIVLYLGLLKRIGDFNALKSACNSLIENCTHEDEAYLALGDLHHIFANWGVEIDQHPRDVYPDPQRLYDERGLNNPFSITDYSFDKALSFYQMALRKKPTSAFIQYQMGRIHFDVGNLDESLRCFSVAAEVAPNNPLARLKYLMTAAFCGDSSNDRTILKLLDRPHDEWRLLRVAVETSSEACARKRIDQKELLAPTTSQGTYRLAFRGLITTRYFELTMPRVMTAIFPRMIDYGHGTKVIDEEILLSDSKAQPLKTLMLFCPQIMLHDRSHALILGPREEYTVHHEALLVLPGAMFNYYHWLLDSLAALLLLEQTNPDLPHVIAVRRLFPYMKETLALAFREPPKIENVVMEPVRYVLHDAAHIPYPARYNVPHPVAVKTVRDRLSRHRSAVTRGKRVFMSRAGYPGRTTRNEKGIFGVLSSFGFATVDPGQMSATEQIELFSDVEIIAGIAGASFANLLFCPWQTRVMIITSTHTHFETFTSIAATIGQKCWVCVGEPIWRPRPYFLWSTHDLTIELTDVRLCVEQIIDDIRIEQRGE